MPKCPPMPPLLSAQPRVSINNICDALTINQAKWVWSYAYGCRWYRLISYDLWPWFVTFYLMNIQRFPYYIHKLSLVPIFSSETNFKFSALQPDFRWPLTLVYDLWLYEHMKVPKLCQNTSLVPIGLQLFKWGHFHIFSLFYVWYNLALAGAIHLQNVS